MKSGNLNFLEHSGALQACNGTALPLPLLVGFIFIAKHQFKVMKNICYSSCNVQFCISKYRKNLHKRTNNSILSALPFWRFRLNEAWRRYLIYWYCIDVSTNTVCHSLSAGWLNQLRTEQSIDGHSRAACHLFVCWNAYVLRNIERYLLHDAAKTEVI
jgi:hypothetical protein